MVFDLTDPDFLANPAPQLAKMRAQAAVVQTRIPLLGKMWVTTNDAAARNLLKSPNIFARDNSKATGKTNAQRFWWLPRTIKPLMSNMLGVDGAAHTRLRGLVDQAFARTQIDDMRPALAKMADGLLDQIDPATPTDLIHAYARPLPLMAICALLGVPVGDREKVARWISPISGKTTLWNMLRALPGLRKTMAHFRADFAIVRDTQRAGLIYDLVVAENAGDVLTDDELLAMVFTLFVAGHETTVHLIGNCVYGLLSNPATRAVLADDHAQIPIMVEEFMRHTSPVMMTKPHFVTQDTVFEGVSLKQGEMIAALLIGANHDPARHGEPDQFKPLRRPNPHIGFGHGPHVCLGMQLARAEAQVAITQLFTRFPNIALADAKSPVRYVKRTGLHGLEKLNVVLAP